MFDQFTLGIEEEFQIVDPVTRELRSHVSEILDEGRMLLGEQIKPEMIQSQIEVGTGVCKNIQEARADITNLTTTAQLPLYGISQVLTVPGTTTVVAEPSTLVLGAIGAVAFVAYGWSRHRREQRRQAAA